MTEHEERVFEAQAEKEFRSHREAPNGRNFLAWNMRHHGGSVAENYAIGMCRTFPNAPGSRMCGACSIKGCDMRHPARLEDYHWVVDRIRAACPDDSIRLWLKDYDSAVMVVFDNMQEGAERKRWRFYAKADPEYYPPGYNLLAMPVDRQKHFIDKQIALWKKFKAGTANTNQKGDLCARQ
jgi:hypothetical protein